MSNTKYRDQRGFIDITKLYIINPVTGCWEGTIPKTSTGYCRFAAYNQKKIFLHRYVFEYYGGIVTSGMQLDHECKVRHCCNPEHLKLVTAAENTRRSNVAKLTMEDVIKIRELEKKYPQRFVAKLYNISHSQVGRIARGVDWK